MCLLFPYYSLGNMRENQMIDTGSVPSFLYLLNITELTPHCSHLIRVIKKLWLINIIKFIFPYCVKDIIKHTMVSCDLYLLNKYLFFPD